MGFEIRVAVPDPFAQGKKSDSVAKAMFSLGTPLALPKIGNKM